MMPSLTRFPLLVSLFSLASGAYGMGSKPSTPPASPPPLSQAKPFRFVELAPVSVPSFYLPNGSRVDSQTEIHKIVESEVNSSRYLRTQSGGRSRLIMSGGVTSFELDVLQLNLKVGWNQTGSIIVTPGVPGATGELDFKLSAFSMDFKIFDRDTGQTYAASYTDTSMSNYKFKVKADIDQITSTIELIYKMKIAETVRKATKNVVLSIENKPAFDLIPWSAKVLSASAELNLVSFDQGRAAGVAPQQVYSIYSACNNQQIVDTCIERWLLDVKITNVSDKNSLATPILDGTGVSQIFVGDHVYVRILGGKP